MTSNTCALIDNFNRSRYILVGTGITIHNTLIVGTGMYDCHKAGFYNISSTSSR